MKSGIRDQAEGKLHQVKGKAREIIGKMIRNSKLEISGKQENAAGKVQEKVGGFKKVLNLNN